MLAALRAVLRSGPAGFAAATATAAGVLAAVTGFLHPVAFLITVGGTLGVTWATFSGARLASAWRYLTRALGEEAAPETVIMALKRLARIHRLEGPRALEGAAASAPDPFLRRAIELSFECGDEDEVRDVLCAEASRHAAEGEAARSVLNTLGKLFPAFGLIGTLLGLALLLRDLGDAELASIGSGLGLAVLTTLYGAILANVVVLPLATKLQAYLGRRALRSEMIIEGTLLVYRSELPTRVERVLRGYTSQSPTEASSYDLRLAQRAA